MRCPDSQPGHRPAGPASFLPPVPPACPSIHPSVCPEVSGWHPGHPGLQGAPASDRSGAWGPRPRPGLRVSFLLGPQFAVQPQELWCPGRCVLDCTREVRRKVRDEASGRSQARQGLGSVAKVVLNLSPRWPPQGLDRCNGAGRTERLGQASWRRRHQPGPGILPGCWRGQGASGGRTTGPSVAGTQARGDGPGRPSGSLEVSEVGGQCLGVTVTGEVLISQI